MKPSKIAVFVLAALVALSVGITIVHATHDTNGGYATMDYTDFVISGTNGMTVTAPVASGVEPPNVLSNRYTINTTEKTIHWTLDLLNLNIGGNRLNSFIALKLPENKQANVTVTTPCLAQDNGGNWETCYVIQSEWSNWLYVRRANEQSLSASTSTRLDINLVLEYRDTP